MTNNCETVPSVYGHNGVDQRSECFLVKGATGFGFKIEGDRSVTDLGDHLGNSERYPLLMGIDVGFSLRG